MITNNGKQNARAKISAVNVLTLVMNFIVVKIMLYDHDATMTHMTGIVDRLKCFVGNLTAYKRSKLMAAKLNMEHVPHKISNAIKN